MMTTQQEFKLQKEQGQAILANLQHFLEQGSDFGIDIKPSLEKLQKAKDKLAQSKLKVAFIGGFSEGKTSIACAWLGESKDNMKISSSESSDEVAIYQITGNNDIEIIDTPGLFGFKEKGGNAEKYKDITKKFVSEADIILYVMNPTNPIKASHKEDLEWLFRTLNLLPRTIFVLGKFDEVADMGDDDDFESEFATKRDKSIIPNLHNAINLTPHGKERLKIVAVSANPFGRGLESHWLKAENQSEFKKLSHIDSLQNATTEIIKQNGGLESITLEAQNSILSDIVHKELPLVREMNDKFKNDIKRFQESQMILQKDMQRATEKISTARIALREFVAKYFSDLIRQVSGTSLETFGDFMQREIGSEGNLMITRVQNAFERHTHSVISELQTNITRFDAERGDFERAVSGYGKQGIAWLQKSGAINSQNILVARNLLKGGLETIGINVGTALNFKPWGAINFAKSANAVLAVAGIALELWDSYQKQKRQEAFEKARNEIVEMLEAQMNVLLGVINDDAQFYALFGGYEHLKIALEDTINGLRELEARALSFDEWVKQGELLEAKIAESSEFSNGGIRY